MASCNILLADVVRMARVIVNVMTSRANKSAFTARHINPSGFLWVMRVYKPIELLRDALSVQHVGPVRPCMPTVGYVSKLPHGYRPIPTFSKLTASPSTSNPVLIAVLLMPMRAFSGVAKGS